MKKIILFCLLWPLTVFTQASANSVQYFNSCPSDLEWEDSSRRYLAECDSKGFIKKERAFFKENGNVSYIRSFTDGFLVHKQVFNLSGDQTQEIRYQQVSDNQRTQSRYRVPLQSPAIETSRRLEQFKDGKFIATAKWVFNNAPVPTPVQFNHLVPELNLVDRSDIEQEDKHKIFIDYSYDETDLEQAAQFLLIPKPKNFKIEIPAIGLERFIQPEGLETYYDSMDLPAPPKTQKQRVAVMDTGFDLQHDNFKDRQVFDWKGEKSINESIYVERLGRPLSHGTHVLDILSFDASNFQFLTYPISYETRSEFEKLARLFNQHQIRFNNMSFGFPRGGNAGFEHMLPPMVINAVDKMITNTPHTLHFIAAGNEGGDVDKDPTTYFPASHWADNTVVVGALNTFSLEPHNLSTYQMVDNDNWKSNWGMTKVDIFCPGSDIAAAAFGGGTIKHSGTSMAAPYCLNQGALKVAQIAPHLNIYQIKELLIKSAFIPDLNKPMACVSGGILYPERAQRVAHLLNKNKALTVREAVLKVRRAGTIIGSRVDPSGEPNTEEYLQKLTAFWQSKNI